MHKALRKVNTRLEKMFSPRIQINQLHVPCDHMSGDPLYGMPPNLMEGIGDQTNMTASGSGGLHQANPQSTSQPAQKGGGNVSGNENGSGGPPSPLDNDEQSSEPPKSIRY